MKIGIARVLLLSAMPYELKDERTGEVRSGVSVYYVSGQPDTRQGRMGVEPVKATLDTSEIKGLSAVPGWYDVDLTLQTASVTRAGQKSTVQLVIPSNFAYVAALAFPPANGAAK